MTEPMTESQNRPPFDSEWGSYDLSRVREWSRMGEPSMADIFGQLHAGVPSDEQLAPFYSWLSAAELWPSRVKSGETIGMHIALITVDARPLPDRFRDENHKALASAAKRFGDSARVDVGQTHGADGYWSISKENHAQVPTWARHGLGCSVPVEIGTCAPGQLVARLMDMGACIRWPYGSTDAVLITTNIIVWKGRLL